MKVLVDLNIALDFLQHRKPFFEEAASLMDAILFENVRGVLPAHGFTTLYYFLARGVQKPQAGEVIQWLLDTFDIAACDKDVLVRAASLQMTDYEDAVTAVCAERVGCSHIVTRNVDDFAGSPVPALPPGEFLQILEIDRSF